MATKKAKVAFSWVLKGDEEDRLWAETYLRNKGRYVPSGTFAELGALMKFVDKWPDSSLRSVELVMKNTWRQRQARKRSIGKKSYNYTFSNVTKRRLDVLASEVQQNLTDTLEDLINQGAFQRDRHKAELKDLKEKHSNAMKDLQSQLTAARQSIKEVLDEFEKHLMAWSLSTTETRSTLLITPYPMREQQWREAAQELCQREMERIVAQFPTAKLARQLTPSWQEASRRKSNTDQTLSRTSKKSAVLIKPDSEAAPESPEWHPSKSLL